jgi:hypothetical protein
MNPFVRRVDINGETIWLKYFTEKSKHEVIVDFEKINDSTFLTGSIEIIDAENSRSTLRIIIPANDGGAITFGLAPMGTNSQNQLLAQPKLARLSENFQVEWLRHFGLKDGSTPCY